MSETSTHPSERSLIVSMIGRPNVGKSSIFNRLMQKQTKAITFNEPGVTRDRHYGITSFDELRNVPEQELVLVDTGGFYPEQVDENETGRKNAFFNKMRSHAHMAIDESDLVLFVVDIREGLLPYDRDICAYLRKSKKPFWLIINKYDSSAQSGHEVDFYSLGIDSQDLFLTSSAHGNGFMDLKERIQTFAYLSKEKGLSDSKLQKGLAPKKDVVARVALIGAPNAGKSTMLNALLGESRALVSDIPGTTMDPIEGYFDFYMGKKILQLDEHKGRIRGNADFVEQYEKFRRNHPDLSKALEDSFENEVDLQEEIHAPLGDAFELDEKEVRDIDCIRSIHIVDTAGIRKQGQIKDVLESQSVYRSLRSITDCDIVMYMIDIEKGITHQDKRLIDVALEKGKSVIILFNKLDLMRDKLQNDQDIREYLKETRFDISWLDTVDIIPVSAKKSQGMHKLFKSLRRTIFVRNIFLPTSEVNKAFYHLVDHHSVLIKGGRAKNFKVKYASQVKADPPTFLVFANRAQKIPENYRKYLKNGIRRLFGIKNTPVHIVVRTGQDLSKKVSKQEAQVVFTP